MATFIIHHRSSEAHPSPEARWQPLRCGSSRLGCDWTAFRSRRGTFTLVEQRNSQTEQRNSQTVHADRNAKTPKSIQRRIINLGRRAPQENLPRAPSHEEPSQSGVDRSGLEASAHAEEEKALDVGQSLAQRNYSQSSVEDGPGVSDKGRGRDEILSADAWTAQISYLMFFCPWARQRDQRESGSFLSKSACLRCFFPLHFHYQQRHLRMTFTWWCKQAKVKHSGRLT